MAGENDGLIWPHCIAVGPVQAVALRLATQTSKTAVCELLRVSWPAVGQSISRVVAELETTRPDRLEGLRRIGIDELRYRVGQRSIR